MNTPENIGFKQLLNSTKHKRCFYDDVDCSAKIIKSHSIQNNRILNKLSVDGHTFMIDTSNLNSDEGFQMGSFGRKKATTFTGFCGKHDDEIFKPIEVKDYSIGDKEQEFLFAYRALAKEYSAKRSSLNFINKFFELCKTNNLLELEKYFPEMLTNEHFIRDLISVYTPMSHGLLDALSRYEKYKNAMKANIKSSKFHSIRTITFVFPTESKIAVSSLINIEFDLEGNLINNVRDPKAIVSPCFLTVFPQNSETYVLLSYLNKRKSNYEFIKSQMLSKSIKEQKNILSNMIVAYCENVVLSPNLWNSFSHEKQQRYVEHFENTVFEKGNLGLNGDLNLFE